MSFINEIEKTLDETYNVSITENGASGYATTNHGLLDLNFKVASYRNRAESDIINDFIPVYIKEPVLAMRWLFFVRDIREGLGERRYFRVVMKYLANKDSNVVRKLLPIFAEYGRYDDIISLLDTAVGGDVVKIIKSTLVSDIVDSRSGKPITLLAKWLPSENASSNETVRTAKTLINRLGIEPKKYRKMLSSLRSYLNVVEKSMSAKDWESIDYASVPSRANLVHNDAFLRNDETRRREFLESLKKGETKINAGTLYPHDIVHKYRNEAEQSWYSRGITEVDDTLEELWKALPDTVKGNNNTIVVADGSDSMYSYIGNTDVIAHDVANALAIYFAERCSGEFKDKYITFSSSPQLVSLDGGTLKANLDIANSHDECSNTNIEAVFNLILNTAVRNNMAQDEMPANILIVSDMEFDTATATSHYGPQRRCDKRLFETIKQKYEAHGYKLPKLIFWNVCSRTDTIPVKENDLGVALVSGFSVNIVKMVMTNETDPYKILLDTILNERYNVVEELMKK